MQADMDELIHVKLDREIVELLVKVGATYEQFSTYECDMDDQSYMLS